MYIAETGEEGLDFILCRGKYNSQEIKFHDRLERVSFDKYLQKFDYSGNPEVQPGDAYYIPKKGTKFSLNDILAPLSAVGSLSYTARLLQGK